MAEAKRIADSLGRERNDFNIEFGPVNVGLHEASIAVDLGGAGIALRTADTADVSNPCPLNAGAVSSSMSHVRSCRAAVWTRPWSRSKRQNASHPSRCAPIPSCGRWWEISWPSRAPLDLRCPAWLGG